jgi:DNA repair ATPase RecN
MSFREYQRYTASEFASTLRDIHELVGTKKQVHEDIKSSRRSRDNYKTRVEDSLKARTLMQKVATEIQTELGLHLTSLVNLALASVFPEPYKLVVNFVERRGTIECDLLFRKDSLGDALIQPMDGSGGGPLDVVSFALRCIFWALDTDTKRPIMFLDEPFKYVSTDLHPLCGQMLREISKKLGMQVIMVSHLPSIIECADKIIGLEYKDGESKIWEDKHESDSVESSNFITTR